MFTIEEKINETEELGKIINKIPLTKSRNERLTNKLTKNRSQIVSQEKNISNNKLYNFTLTHKERNIKKINQSLTIDDISKFDLALDNINYNYFKSGNLLFEIFINSSEFDLKKFDFYISYTNLCSLLREANIIDKKLYNDTFITQNDLDIILKKTKNNNNYKKFNFKEFSKYLSYIIYKIDYWHFIDKPKTTFNFNINKIFDNYFQDGKMSFISLIYNYVLYVRRETNINEIINPILSNIKNIFIHFCITKIKNDEKDCTNTNMMISKNKFNSILNVMKYLGIFPVLINLKELIIMYHFILDDNNDNKYLDVEELTLDVDISFKKFCELFLCLCIYIKNKKQIILDQFSYLLKEENKNNKFETELKYGQREGIIKYILNLNTLNISQNKNFNEKNKDKNLKKKSNEKNFYIDLNNLKIKHIDFLFKIFEAYSSHYNKYLTYQISFKDILIFFKDCKFIINNEIKKNNNYSLKDKYYKAKKIIKKNISKLRTSIHSFDRLLNNNKIDNNKNNTNNYYYINKNKILLRDIEIFYSKVSKRADINNRLNFKEFIKFLHLSLDKLGFNSISELTQFLQDKNINNLNALINRRNELQKINMLYYQIDKNDIFNIIQQLSPIINIYFISLANKINKYKVTFDLFLKIFREFDLYPNIISNNILKNIFDKIYQIHNEKIIKTKELLLEKILEEKEVGYDDILIAIGIIIFYLKNNSFSHLDEKKILFGLFYRIAESKNLKLELNFNYNFSDELKNKLIKISKIYFDFTNFEEPKYKLFLNNPFL